MLIQKNNFYVITGGPGAGKTTLLKSLQLSGYLTVDEVARDIIRAQNETGGEALPWKNRKLYTALMLTGSVNSFLHFAETDQICFFDRGIIDTLCYSEIIGNGISDDMNHYANNYRYNKTVFILPPWKEIYETDDERKQDWQEAEYTYQKMKELYQYYSYSVIDVPVGTVEGRTNFVLNYILPAASNQ